MRYVPAEIYSHIRYLLSLWFVLVFILFLNLSLIFSGLFLLCLSLLLFNGLLYSLSLRNDTNR